MTFIPTKKDIKSLQAMLKVENLSWDIPTEPEAFLEHARQMLSKSVYDGLFLNGRVLAAWAVSESPWTRTFANWRLRRRP